MFKSSAERESGRGASRNLGTALGVRGAKTARGTKNTRTQPDTPKHSRTQPDTAAWHQCESSKRKERNKRQKKGASPRVCVWHIPESPSHSFKAKNS